MKNLQYGPVRFEVSDQQFVYRFIKFNVPTYPNGNQQFDFNRKMYRIFLHSYAQSLNHILFRVKKDNEWMTPYHRFNEMPKC